MQLSRAARKSRATRSSWRAEKARLRYEFEAGQFGGFFAVYIVEEGDSLEESGGFPEVTCTQSCTDEPLLRKPAGSYYLDVTGSGEWNIVVEEER